MAEEKMISEKWVYTGQVMQPDLTDIYQPLDKDGKLLDEKLPYSVKRVVNHVVGGVYELECTPDRSRVRRAGAKFVGTYPDASLVGQWHLGHRATRVALETDRLEKKAKDFDFSVLDPLRERYRRARSWNEQVAIELLLLRYLRGK